MKDERIQSVLHRSQSAGFSILFFGMLAIFMFRQLYLGQSFREYGDFLLVWLVAGGYAIVVSALRGGLDPSSCKSHRGRWRVSLMAALVITAFQVYHTIARGIGFAEPINWISSLLTFVIALIFSVAFVTLVQRFLELLYRTWERHNLE